MPEHDARQPQLTGACSREPTRTRPALRRAAPEASDPILRQRFPGTAAALVRDGVLAVAAELARGTIETTLAKSDLKLGIETLLRGL